MALAWEDFFAPPVLASGFSTSAITAIDEWPFSSADGLSTNTISGSASHTIGLDFDLSSSPGAKKGFRLWIWFDASVAAGFSPDEIRLIDGNGPTTLHTNSSPTWPTLDDEMGILTYDFPDSAFSGDPDLDDLTVEIDITNLSGGNNILTVYGARLSKSPFTTAQESPVPSTLAGLDYICYRADDLKTLGAVDDEEVVVWPDASGAGRHALRWVGSAEIVYKDGTPNYVDCPSSHDTRFLWKFLEAATNENAVTHCYVYPTTITSDHPIITGIRNISASAQEFEGVAGAGSPGSKILHGYSSSAYVIMVGAGDGPSHLTGGSPSINTWARSTLWLQISGNDHFWENDNTTPIIDGASGANQIHGGSLFHHESSDRQYEGRVGEIWLFIAPSASVDETDVTDANAEWVAGLASFETTVVYATADGTIANVVDEGDLTTDLFQSVDDDPATPSDSDWVNNVPETASVFFDLTNMPGDFGNAETASIIVRERTQFHVTGTYRLFARLYQSNETTALSDEVQIVSRSADSSFANTSPITFTGLNTSADASVWNGAKIRFRWEKV